jgi:glycosyltransferase involved in cell wall biosynthesis
MTDAEDSCNLSIVMPCLNEAETLGICIQKAQDYLRRNELDAEIVVADNGSTDGSQEIAIERGARLVHVETRGYGAALMGGVSAARGEYVIIGDADDSYDFSNLDPFIEKLRQGYDLVMGNRFQGGIQKDAMPLLHRYFGNPVLSTIGKLFFGARVGDFHCGLRAFKRQAILGLDLRTIGMEYASEMVVKARLHGLKITEVPTVLYPDGRSRRPHLRTWRDGWRHLRFLLLFSPRWLFLYPGIGMIIMGLALGTWLLPRPRRIGSIELDVNTLFYAALMVVLGVQSISFAVFTKVFGIQEGLLPEDPQLSRMLKKIDLEKGLVAGLALILLGIGSSVFAFVSWGEGGFGPLDPTQSLRLVIPGGAMITTGFQVILASFFLSILELRRR